MQEDAIVIESDWMASAQLDRLVAASGAESFGLTYDVAGPAADRGVDPTIIVAVVSGVFNVLVPFMTKLAQRLFATEPDASLTCAARKLRQPHQVPLTAPRWPLDGIA